MTGPRNPPALRNVPLRSISPGSLPLFPAQRRASRVPPSERLLRLPTQPRGHCLAEGRHKMRQPPKQMMRDRFLRSGRRGRRPPARKIPLPRPCAASPDPLAKQRQPRRHQPLARRPRVPPPWAGSPPLSVRLCSLAPHFGLRTRLLPRSGLPLPFGRICRFPMRNLCCCVISSISNAAYLLLKTANILWKIGFPTESRSLISKVTTNIITFCVLTLTVARS